jgi:hypothetical protein
VITKKKLKCLQNVLDINLEMGLNWFIPKLHTRTEELVKMLGLAIKPYYGDNPETDIKYYIRGKWPQNVQHLYNLNSYEQFDSSKKLLRLLVVIVVYFFE